jgi:putative tryptophan/tyrosine transport system substrate-binding protein
VRQPTGRAPDHGPAQAELYRRVAQYITRIFEGVAPGDLPIEQPTHYDIVIGLKTVSALGLAIPPAILARADQAIE